MVNKIGNQPSQWLKSKLFLIGAIIIITFLGLNFYNIWQQQRLVNQEIKGLEDEVSSLYKTNLELSELIQYLNSTAYVEKKARTDLGLKKAGEQTVIIPESTTDSRPTSQNNTKNNNKGSNLEKWWQYFFNNNTI